MSVADAAALEAMGRSILDRSKGAAREALVAFGELTILADNRRIVELMTLLRDDAEYRFAQLLDVCGVDYPDRVERFEVVYHLLSLTKNRRVRVKTSVEEDAATPSVASVFPCADWYERETFDMYGIYFDGHPDLRRILTDYGFHGHPLRKDFPMTGYVEVRWDEALKRVIYEPVKLPAEYRSFDFLSPWEGARQALPPGGGAMHILPGDEKATQVPEPPTQGS